MPYLKLHVFSAFLFLCSFACLANQPETFPAEKTSDYVSWNLGVASLLFSPGCKIKTDAWLPEKYCENPSLFIHYSGHDQSYSVTLSSWQGFAISDESPRPNDFDHSSLRSWISVNETMLTTMMDIQNAEFSFVHNDTQKNIILMDFGSAIDRSIQENRVHVEEELSEAITIRIFLYLVGLVGLIYLAIFLSKTSKLLKAKVSVSAEKRRVERIEQQARDELLKEQMKNRMRENQGN